MKSIYNVPQNELIEKTALELKKIPSIKAPAWSEFVKTGAHKERAPAREDWWHVRAAAILRTVSKIGPIGVSKLRTKYGGKKNRGVKPEKFYKGSGKIIRLVLQQLEEAELVKKAEKGIHKGRIIAPKGMSILDNVAAKISGKKPEAKAEKPVEIKKEPVKKEESKQTKKPEAKKQDIKTEQSQEIKKPAEEKPAEAKAESKVEEKKDEPKKELKQEQPKEDVPAADEPAKK